METLTPEEPANLLLLGCGDPRNILFTIYNEADDSKQGKKIRSHSFDSSVDFQPRERWISLAVMLNLQS